MREHRPYLSGTHRAVRHRCGRGRQRRILARGILGLVLIGFTSLADPAPRFIWNASASAPIGLYWNMGAGQVSWGGLVLAWAPDAARELAAARHYLPANVPLVKRIAALDGDTICSVGNVVFVNGRAVAERLAQDGRGRSMPGWTGCHKLVEGEVLLLMEGVSDSFDGRYFGPIRSTAIIGKLVPVWTE